MSDFNVNDIVLKNTKNEQIKQKRATLGIEAGMRYVIYIPPYHKENEVINFADETINIHFFDIKNWLKTENLKKNDYLLISAVNLDKKEYKLEKITAKKYNEDKLLAANKDKIIIKNWPIFEAYFIRKSP